MGIEKREGCKMALLEKAIEEAKRNGKKVSGEVAKGLKAIQAMHDMCAKQGGSPYKTYKSQK